MFQGGRRQACRWEQAIEYFRWAKGCACCNQNSAMSLRLLLSVLPGALFLSVTAGTIVAREVKPVQLEIEALTAKGCGVGVAPDGRPVHVRGR